jgi:hypothetical protein
MASTFVLATPRLGTFGTRIGTRYSGLTGQPQHGSQVGTGIPWEMIRTWWGVVVTVCLVVNALATNPAKITEKMEAWTASFMEWLPPG